MNDIGATKIGDVGAIFDAMADEYDRLDDLWYSWLFARLHEVIRSSTNATGKSVLDVGCGTGFQSLLFANVGAEVTGVDIAVELIRMARNKADGDRETLFRSPYDFARDSAHAAVVAEGPLSFAAASATDLPFCAETFDLTNCSGSTLSFIPDYVAALTEMHRVTRRNGVLILEVENKYNIDLVWPLVDWLTGGRIGYGQTLGQTIRNLLSARSKHLQIEFPFTSPTGDVVMPLRLFSRSRLLTELDRIGFCVRRTYGVHFATNVLPSVVLDTSTPSPLLTTAFEVLRRLDERLSGAPLARALGCSTIYIAERR